MIRTLLILNGLAFVGTATWVGVDPARASEALGFPAWGSAGGQEFLANFLGLYAAVGLCLLGCAGSRAMGRRQEGLRVLGFLATGLAAGRLISWTFGFGGSPIQLGYLGWESATAVLVWWWTRRPSRERSATGPSPTP